MREKVDRDRLEKFLHAFASEADRQVRVFLTGGATAVLRGWRDSTVDIDLRLIPDNDRMLRRKLIAPDQLKEFFEAIVPLLYRFPAIDPDAFRQNLNSILSKSS